MKILLSFLLLCLPGFAIFAQTPAITVIQKEIVSGKNLITNTDIPAREYVFPGWIGDYYLDTTTNLLTVQLRNMSKNGKLIRNKGKLILYDMENNSVKWTKKINYLKSSIKQYDDVLIQITETGTYRLNIETGQNMWMIPSQLAYIDDHSGIGVGYPLNAGIYARLEAYNLRWGNKVWFRGINRDFGWNDLFYFNDSVVMLIASGLHTINFKNGSGWDYNTTTGTNDYTATILLNAAGLVLGALTGYATMYTGHNVITDLVSNVWDDGTNLFFASREKIACLDYEGKVQWSTELPKRKTSKSALFVQDDIIYMINLGYAFLNGQMTLFEKPYISAYNRNSGDPVYFKEISDKKEFIADYLTGNNEIILLFNNRISRYAMNDGSLINEKIIPTGNAGNLQKFVSDEISIESDSLYRTLDSFDPTKIYVVTDSLKLLTLTDEFNLVDVKAALEQYVVNYTTDEFKYLTRPKNTIVINEENRKIAELKATPDALLVGNKLFDMQEKSFIIIDLSSLSHKTVNIENLSP